MALVFAPRRKEASIEDRFVQLCRDNGAWALKLIILNVKHFPDRTVLVPGGKIFFVEFKAPGKKLKAGQRVLARKLRNLGFKVYVEVQTIDEVNRIIHHEICPPPLSKTQH